MEDRETSLRNIDEALDRIVSTLARRNPDMRLQRIAGGGNNETRIMIGSGRAQVKVETSPVGRGTILAPQSLRVADAVEDTFGFAEMQVVAFEDLYGSKLHAALDRQHPRDFYDVKLLYENEGLPDSLFRVFLVYVPEGSQAAGSLDPRIRPGYRPPYRPRAHKGLGEAKAGAGGRRQRTRVRGPETRRVNWPVQERIPSAGTRRRGRGGRSWAPTRTPPYRAPASPCGRASKRSCKTRRRVSSTFVLAEALDRVSRDQADVAILYKNLKFSDVRIVHEARS